MQYRPALKVAITAIALIPLGCGGEEAAGSCPEGLGTVDGVVRIENSLDIERLACVGRIVGELRIATILAEVSLPSLETVDGALSVEANPMLVSLRMPALTGVAGELELVSNPSLTEVDISALTQVETLIVEDNGALRRLAPLSSLTIAGNVTVGHQPWLADLTWLGALVAVQGSLRIASSAFVDLHGLEGLTSVGGGVALGLASNGNSALMSLAGLASLTSVGGLDIAYLPYLRDLDGLASLRSVGGDLRITGNPLLTSLDRLGSLTHVGGVLEVSANAALMTLPGFDALTSLGGLRVYRNDTLTSVAGFPNVTEITNSVVLSGPALTTFSGFERVESLGGGLAVFDTSIGDLRAFRSLIALNAVSDNQFGYADNGEWPIEPVGGLWLSKNPSLHSLIGLRNLVTVLGDIGISRTGLTELSDLAAVRTIGHHLLVRGNDALLSLGGLAAVQSVEGLSVADNAALGALGLSALAEVREVVDIRSNASLPTCRAQELLLQLTVSPPRIAVYDNDDLASCD